MHSKIMMNFTTSEEDLMRYQSAEDLRRFYQHFHLSGLELMPMSYPASTPLIEPDMIAGVHTRAINDWMDLNRSDLIRHYREDLKYANEIGASYVVFHLCQVSPAEALGYPFVHTSEEVIDASCSLINELLDGQHYSFWFLMENMWYTGLDICHADLTRKLLNGIHYSRKGFMLDTGHLMHTDLSLSTQEEASEYILRILENHRDILPYIKGLHLNQSLTGDLIRSSRQNPPQLARDSNELFAQVFRHVFRVDRHEPFTDVGVKKILKKADPEFITLEYITTNRTQHARFLAEGMRALH